MKQSGIPISVADLTSKITDAELENYRSERPRGWGLNTDQPIVIQPKRFLLKDVIVKGELNVFGGPTGSGKTFWLMGLLRAILLGEEEFMGYPISSFAHRPIIYVGLDNNLDFFAQKFWKCGLGSLSADLNDGESVSSFLLKILPSCERWCVLVQLRSTRSI